MKELKNTEKIAAFLKKTLKSGLLDSEYLEVCFEERDNIKIHISGHALPPSYDTLHGQLISAKHDRKVFMTALKEGSLACLPGPSGYADTQAAVNAVNGTVYNGTRQLLLKDFQKQNGFPSAEYLTFEQIEKAAKFAGQEGYLLNYGSKGVTLNFQVDNEPRSVRLFNLAQVKNPDAVRAYAAHQAQERESYLKQKHGEKYVGQKPQNSSREIVCSSTEPAEYIGQYLSAVSLGARFKATKEQAIEFSKKTEAFIFQRSDNGHINPYNLSRLGSQASKYCKTFIPELFVSGQKQEKAVSQSLSKEAALTGQDEKPSQSNSKPSRKKDAELSR